MRSLAVLAFSSFLLAACAGSKSDRPDWIDNPGEGAVGSSTMHIRGRYYQEELAISRARERLAAQYGVEVSSIQTIQERVKDERAYVTSDREVLQQVKKQTVRAHVRAIWHDRVRDELWVWVYPVK
jgi:hypothetical protein